MRTKLERINKVNNFKVKRNQEGKYKIIKWNVYKTLLKVLHYLLLDKLFFMDEIIIKILFA